MRSHGEVVEYRVEVVNHRAMRELRMQVELSAACGNPAALVRQMERELHAVLSLRVPISIVPAGTLPRFEMKAKRWTQVEGGAPSR